MTGSSAFTVTVKMDSSEGALVTLAAQAGLS
jgi:hypothetical protein